MAFIMCLSCAKLFNIINAAAASSTTTTTQTIEGVGHQWSIILTDQRGYLVTSKQVNLDIETSLSISLGQMEAS